MFNIKYGRKVVCLTKDAVQLLNQYQWPGNVRELRNLMERLFAENMTDVIGLRSLKEWYHERMNAANYANTQKYKEVIITPDKSPIHLGMGNADNKLNLENLKTAFKKADGNITKASELLGIHKTTFYRAMKDLNITRDKLSEN